MLIGQSGNHLSTRQCEFRTVSIPTVALLLKVNGGFGEACPRVHGVTKELAPSGGVGVGVMSSPHTATIGG